MVIAKISDVPGAPKTEFGTPLVEGESLLSEELARDLGLVREALAMIDKKMPPEEKGTEFGRQLGIVIAESITAQEVDDYRQESGTGILPSEEKARDEILMQRRRTIEGMLQDGGLRVIEQLRTKGSDGFPMSVSLVEGGIAVNTVNLDARDHLTYAEVLCRYRPELIMTDEGIALPYQLVNIPQSTE